MAIESVKISDLKEATSLDGLKTLGADNNNESVKVGIELLRGNTAYQEWHEQTGGTYDEWIEELQEPASEAASALNQYLQDTQAVISDLISATNTAKDNAAMAAENAQEIADHPIKVYADNYVYEWDKETQAYIKTSIYVKGDKGDKGEPATIQNGTIATGQPGTASALTFTYIGDTEDGEPIYRADGSIPQGLPGDGSGDMEKATYDKNNNGVVDDSEKLGGQLPTYYGTATDIAAINGKIPLAASPTNQLADKDFVNSSIANMAANYVTFDAAGNAFSTKAALTGAEVFYHGGAAYTPSEHDYVTVLADESQDGGCWRYTYTGTTWSAQYRVNEAPMTQAQLNALNSGITAELVAKIDNSVSDTATILTTDWQQNETSLYWEVEITDNRLTSNSIVTMWEADKASQDILGDAEVLKNMPVTITENEKYFTVQAVNKPSDSINIIYTIQ